MSRKGVKRGTDKRIRPLVPGIRAALQHPNARNSQIAKEFGVSAATVRKIANGEIE